MSAHTPGPWQCGGRFITANDGGRIVISATETIPVADARLIAAAPDLLAALQDLLRIADGSEPCVGEGYGIKLNAARGAIAKATGAANE